MPEAEAEVREEAPGRATVKLRGWLSAQSTAKCWQELQTRLAKLSPRSLTIDASEVRITGGIGAALLRYLAEGGMTPGAQVVLQGLNKQAETILNTFTSEDYRQYRPHPPPKVPLIVEVGAVVRGWWQGLRHEIAFIGSVMRALPQAVARPRRMRWREVRCVIETAGANALPVVAVICVLTGVVTVLEASHPLAKFGAQIFLADVIGFSSLRDTGPMVTAILLAGRSGSAFAAELGTMKVNEELDALTTMGLDPVRFLVLQRIVAAIILTPLLTLFGMLMCMLGGMLVMRSLGFPPLMIFHHILNRVGMGDFAVGLSKAAIFGLVIGSVACLRGLQTGTGPSAVGASTTRSVIACILLIIVADTVFSAAQYFLT